MHSLVLARARAREKERKARRAKVRRKSCSRRRRGGFLAVTYAVGILLRESLFAAAMAAAFAAGMGWRPGGDPDSALRGRSIVATCSACSVAAVCELCVQCWQRLCFAARPFWAARDGRCAARAGRG